MFIFILMFLQLELIFQLCFNFYLFFIKQLSLSKLNNPLNFINSNNLSLYTLIICIFFFSEKNQFYILYFYSFILYICMLLSSAVFLNYLYLTRNNINLYLFINLFVYIFIYMFAFVTSLITFLFIIELFTILYYFYFLNNYNTTNQSLLKYKNSLLFFLWNSFLTTLFFNLMLFFVLKSKGTTDFDELNTLSVNYWVVTLLLISIFWKLGLPIFHFFKIELYKYLLKESIFLFSIVTLIINTYIYIFIIFQYFIYSILFTYNLFIFLFIFLFILVINNLNITNIISFFAYSSLITITTITSLLLI